MPLKTKSNGQVIDRVITARAERRDAVLDLIRGARQRVSVSLFRCSDKAVFGELTAAVDRGVEVDVLMTSRAKGGKKKLKKLWTRLEATGAKVHSYTDPVVKYHAKYLVADEGPALITSLNFTRKCFEDTCDAIVLTHDPEIVQGLRLLMEADREGGAAPATLPDRLVIGPERARRQFTALVSQAQTSLQLIDAKLSDPGLIELLNQRKRAGVQVEIHGAKLLGGLQSHGKIMLIDGKRAVIGSVALAALCLDFRREVAIVVDEPSAVAEIDRLFRSISAAAGASGTAPAATVGGV